MKHTTLLRAAALCALLAAGAIAHADIEFPAPWFETFKDSATDAELQRFLHAMPKGGDLHHHTTGSGLAEWWLELGIAAQQDGYRYFTKTRIENCRYGTNEFGNAPYLLLFRTIDETEWASLPVCERSEYTPLDALSDVQAEAYLDGMRLDQAHEGRMEFFEAHWSRIGALATNPHIVAEVIARNMIAFGGEGMVYLEAQVPVFGFVTAEGNALTPDQVLDIYRARMARPDVVASGMTLRMQISLLRFHPDAEDMLRRIWAIVARHPDVMAVNMVGREDNDKGYPARFLDTVRELRRAHSGVRLSIHAGEVDEPNDHIRDTLLLGAERIGHAVNLISDPEMMMYMRDRYLVEINLVSNLLLEYVDDYDAHPFPEYLRFGIPVALSTDDRGMWDSTMTDEFFVAVREFDLSWQEVVSLSRNSLAYSFIEQPLRDALVADFEARIEDFESRFRRSGLSSVATTEPARRGFVCRRYALCGSDPR